MSRELGQVRRAALIGLAFGAGAFHLAIVGVLIMLMKRKSGRE